jgi:AcrR family transcriptional regulator
MKPKRVKPNASGTLAIAPARSMGQNRSAIATVRSREISDVALRLFAERGFADVTIKDIASRLRINTALIYYYFKNKEDLFRACLEAAVYDAMDTYSAIKGTHTDPVESINGWFYANIKNAKVISNMVKVMVDYGGSSLRLPTVDRLIEHFYEEECWLLARAFDKGAALGIFRPVESSRLARFVSSHLDGIMIAAIIRPEFDVEEAVATLRSLLFDRLGHQPAKARRRPRPPRLRNI